MRPDRSLQATFSARTCGASIAANAFAGRPMLALRTLRSNLTGTTLRADDAASQNLIPVRERQDENAILVYVTRNDRAAIVAARAGITLRALWPNDAFACRPRFAARARFTTFAAITALTLGSLRAGGPSLTLRALQPDQSLQPRRTGGPLKADVTSWPGHTLRTIQTN